MRTARLVLFTVIVFAGMASLSGGPVDAQQPAPAVNELSTTIGDGFTIASVGDIIIAYPASQNTDPAFTSLIKVIRDADVATGNYESHIIDGRTFKGSSMGPFGGTPEVAQDVKAMGFDIVGRSNNHIGEFGPEGLFETNARLEKAGIVYAGSGETYWAARAPRFFTTSKGRVGLVTTASSYAQNVMAAPPRGEWPGRGGQSALRLTRNFLVPPSMWEAVSTIRQAFPTGGSLYPPSDDTDGQITILLQKFKKANIAKPRFSYQMNAQDLKDLLAMVREGKSKSDFMAVSIHSHETDEADTVDAGTTPGDFMPVFAKAAIDAGADAFFGSGVHVARGIEIYKGRPIFYGLGEFFRQMDTIGIAATGCTGEGGGFDLYTDTSCRGVRQANVLKYENFVAVSTFVRGQVSEIRLYPTDLGWAERMAHRGIPKTASPEVAQRVLARLQKLSAPYGTSIAIEGNVGVIRPAPAPR